MDFLFYTLTPHQKKTKYQIEKALKMNRLYNRLIPIKTC